MVAPMAVEPRAALDRLVAALEAHYSAIVNRKSETDPRIDDAYDVLADAFDLYDDALAREYSEVTPFMLVDDDHDDDDVDESDLDGHIDLDTDDAEMIVVNGDSTIASEQVGGHPAEFGYDY